MLSDEKKRRLADQTKDKPLILKLGSRSIEFGICGDAKPLVHISSSEFSQLQSFKVDPGQIFWGHSINSKDVEHLNKSGELSPNKSSLELDLESFKFLFYPDLLAYRDSENLLNSLEYRLRNHLFDIFEALFKKITFNAVNAKIFILEDLFHNEWYKKTMSDVLLSQLQARSVVFLPNSVMCIVGAGIQNGLIVDCGWSAISVEPVYENRLLTNYSAFTRRGGMMIHYKTVTKLQENGVKKDFDEVEKLIVECNDSSIPAYDAVNECLFPEIDSADTDMDEQKPASLVVNTIAGLPVDIRKELAGHIIITGGLGRIDWLRQKLIQEISCLVKREGFKFTTGQNHSLGSWQGASLFASTILPRQKSNGIIQELRRD
ncbi:hypothetical protein FOA43_003037 [Brettanomyces nanus]|uniref:Uncharacterized protein n=1 Tax=Eeniella nana TaxID=13502 RepID=A0A875S401_EENNA|nr:uncharacterized protein FOA43_003037 [Brettanomyces nanus]QPG75678.1 hypothetical protein FOA43_003037 [Brettanomyces nanus]